METPGWLLSWLAIFDVENKMNLSQCDDTDLIEMYGRLDPSRAPALSSQVKAMLIKRGFIIRENDIGHEILPSRDKLQKLIGVETRIRTKVYFGGCARRFWMASTGSQRFQFSW